MWCWKAISRSRRRPAARPCCTPPSAEPARWYGWNAMFGACAATMCRTAGSARGASASTSPGRTRRGRSSSCPSRCSSRREEGPTRRVGPSSVMSVLLLLGRCRGPLGGCLGGGLARRGRLGRGRAGGARGGTLDRGGLRQLLGAGDDVLEGRAGAEGGHVGLLHLHG